MIRKNTTRTTVLSLSALGMLATGAVLYAGPLAPPAGPVASSYKTLNEVEPRIAINATNTPGDADSVFRITQPGSYYLTGNLTGVAGKRGIEIAANGVTIDLSGFSLTGVPGALTGILGETGSDGTVISNGTLTNWPLGGVSVRHLARVSELTIRACSAPGLATGDKSNVVSCTASGNTGPGFSVGSDSLVSSCVASTNTGMGFDLTHSSRVQLCVSTYNGSEGINIGSASTASECTADDNGGAGITTSDQANVLDCSASGNVGAGIQASFGVLVARCAALVNDGPGIQAGSGCRIENNHCRHNGAAAVLQAGIHITAGTSRTVIMNNTCSSNDSGIKVDGTNCLVKGNTCTTNTINFEIAANNRVASILVPAYSPAISGNVGGTAITDSDANFAY